LAFFLRPLDRYEDLGALRVGNDSGRAQAGVGHRFQPDGLPDAGGRRVVDAARFQDLLAARLRAAVARVPDADDQLLLAALLEGVGDVETEAVVTAAVDAEFLAVDPDSRLPIAGTEVQER